MSDTELVQRKPYKPESRGWDRGLFDEMVKQLRVYRVSIIPELEDVGAFVYRVIFPFRLELWAAVTVVFSLKEWQTDSDLVIQEMFTSPEGIRSHGCGGKVLGYLLDWAKRNNLNEVRATQVSDPRSKQFWTRHGFVECPAPNVTSDFVHRFGP
ncbi:MAG: GNAT family N-acetyltransferase [Patescibacteria group bacterium]